jgi:NAD(P)-dependent dehydrogenase (short-subunit alcohol dehydrogenase family)
MAMNVVVTGASAGIGFELVKLLLANGGVRKVVGIARRRGRLDELSVFARGLDAGDRFSPLCSDVNEVSAETLFSVLDRVDVLVNNAGLLVNRPFGQLTVEDFEAVYRTNVFGPARLIRLLLPLMGGESPSHIVNIGSMGGVQGSAKFPGLSAYSSSKAALAGLTECLAEEFRDSNISVNCLALGAVRTEMLESAFPGYVAPLTPTEMAAYVADFALNGGKYFNGKVLPVSSTTP